MQQHTRKILWIIVLWQFISVLLMGLGVWPDNVVWVNVVLIAAFIALTDPFDGLLLVIASIPFYVVIPNPYFASMPMWRILFVWLFIVWAGRTAIRQRDYFQKLIRFRQMYRRAREMKASKWELIMNTLARIDSRFMSWDKYLALFLFVLILSVLFAHFKLHAIKQIIFLINIYLVYVVLINATTTRERITDLIKYSAISTAIIVFLGYVQFIATLFSSPYYFWQYWAEMISRLYFGQPLANVLIYSNSWFSYTSGGQSLRMFSIMPDSHSFGMIAVLCMGFCLPLLSYYSGGKMTHVNPKALWKVLTHRTYYIWYAIRFSGLAVILSGTRGIWVGMLPTLVISLYLYFRKFAVSMMKKVVIAQLLIILFFILAPAINYGLQQLRISRYEENFIDRARSIYDLGEDSNVGRIIIWKESLVYSALHPFGIGYGNFIVSIVRDVPPNYSFDQVSNEKNLRYNLPQKFVSAHSQYLNLLVEIGFAGLLSFLLFFGKALSAMWVFIQKHKNEENIFTMMVISMAMVFIWFLAYGIFDVTLFNDRILMYFFIALGTVGLILRRYDSQSEAFPEKSRKEVISDIMS